MCLACVHTKTQKEQYGYKVFKKIGGSYFYPGFHLSQSEREQLERAIESGDVKALEVGKWFKDEADYDLNSSPWVWNPPKNTKFNVSYPTGMHVFFLKRDAKTFLRDTPEAYGKLVVKRVKTQKVVASGYEEATDKNGGTVYLKTMVCKKLKIEDK